MLWKTALVFCSRGVFWRRLPQQLIKTYRQYGSNLKCLVLKSVPLLSGRDLINANYVE
jgi:hypothetical protein